MGGVLDWTGLDWGGGNRRGGNHSIARSRPDALNLHHPRGDCTTLPALRVHGAFGGAMGNALGRGGRADRPRAEFAIRSWPPRGRKVVPNDSEHNIIFQITGENGSSNVPATEPVLAADPPRGPLKSSVRRQPSPSCRGSSSGGHFVGLVRRRRWRSAGGWSDSPGPLGRAPARAGCGEQPDREPSISRSRLASRRCSNMRLDGLQTRSIIAA
mgnify:CR=1 FL=1